MIPRCPDKRVFFFFLLFLPENYLKMDTSYPFRQDMSIRFYYCFIRGEYTNSITFSNASVWKNTVNRKYEYYKLFIIFFFIIRMLAIFLPCPFRLHISNNTYISRYIRITLASYVRNIQISSTGQNSITAYVRR